MIRIRHQCVLWLSLIGVWLSISTLSDEAWAEDLTPLAPPLLTINSVEDIPLGWFDDELCRLSLIPIWDEAHNSSTLLLQARCSDGKHPAIDEPLALWELNQGGFNFNQLIYDFYLRQNRVRHALLRLYNQERKHKNPLSLNKHQGRVTRALQLLKDTTDPEFHSPSEEKTLRTHAINAVIMTLRTRCEMEILQRSQEADDLGKFGSERNDYINRNINSPCAIDSHEVEKALEQLSKPKENHKFEDLIEDPIRYLVGHTTSYIQAELTEREALERAKIREQKFAKLLNSYAAKVRKSWLDGSFADNDYIRLAASEIAVYGQFQRFGFGAITELLSGNDDPDFTQWVHDFQNSSGIFADQELRYFTGGAYLLAGTAFASGELVFALAVSSKLAGSGKAIARNFLAGIGTGIALQASGATEWVSHKLVESIETHWGESSSAQYLGGIAANMIMGGVPMFLAGPKLSEIPKLVELLRLPILGQNSLRARLAWGLVGGLGNNARMLAITGLNLCADSIEGAPFDPFSYERAKGFSSSSAASSLFILAAIAGGYAAGHNASDPLSGALRGAQFGLGLDTQDAYGDFKKAVLTGIQNGSLTGAGAFALRTLAIALDADSVVAGMVSGAASVSSKEVAETKELQRALLDAVREANGITQEQQSDQELLSGLKREGLDSIMREPNTNVDTSAELPSVPSPTSPTPNRSNETSKLQSLQSSPSSGAISWLKAAIEHPGRTAKELLTGKIFKQLTAVKELQTQMMAEQHYKVAAELGFDVQRRTRAVAWVEAYVGDLSTEKKQAILDKMGLASGYRTIQFEAGADPRPYIDELYRTILYRGDSLPMKLLIEALGGKDGLTETEIKTALLQLQTDEDVLFIPATSYGLVPGHSLSKTMPTPVVLFIPGNRQQSVRLYCILIGNRNDAVAHLEALAPSHEVAFDLVYHSSMGEMETQFEPRLLLLNARAGREEDNFDDHAHAVKDNGLFLQRSDLQRELFELKEDQRRSSIELVILADDDGSFLSFHDSNSINQRGLRSDFAKQGLVLVRLTFDSSIVSSTGAWAITDMKVVGMGQGLRLKDADQREIVIDRLFDSVARYNEDIVHFTAINLHRPELEREVQQNKLENLEAQIRREADEFVRGLSTKPPPPPQSTLSTLVFSAALKMAVKGADPAAGPIKLVGYVNDAGEFVYLGRTDQIRPAEIIAAWESGSCSQVRLTVDDSASAHPQVVHFTVFHAAVAEDTGKSRSAKTAVTIQKHNSQVRTSGEPTDTGTQQPPITHVEMGATPSAFRLHEVPTDMVMHLTGRANPRLTALQANEVLMIQQLDRLANTSDQTLAFIANYAGSRDLLGRFLAWHIEILSTAAEGRIALSDWINFPGLEAIQTSWRNYQQAGWRAEARTGELPAEKANAQIIEKDRTILFAARPSDLAAPLVAAEEIIHLQQLELIRANEEKVAAWIRRVIGETALKGELDRMPQMLRGHWTVQLALTQRFRDTISDSQVWRVLVFIMERDAYLQLLSLHTQLTLGHPEFRNAVMESLSRLNRADQMDEITRLLNNRRQFGFTPDILAALSGLSLNDIVVSVDGTPLPDARRRSGRGCVIATVPNWQTGAEVFAHTPSIFETRAVSEMNEGDVAELRYYLTDPAICTDPYAAQEAMRSRLRAAGEGVYDTPLERALKFSDNISRGLSILISYDTRHGTSYALETAAEIVRHLRPNPDTHNYGAMFSEFGRIAAGSQRQDSIQLFFAAVNESPARTGLTYDPNSGFTFSSLLTLAAKRPTQYRPDAQQVQGLLDEAIHRWEVGARTSGGRGEQALNRDTAATFTQVGGDYFFAIGDQSRLEHFDTALTRLNPDRAELEFERRRKSQEKVVAPEWQTVDDLNRNTPTVLIGTRELAESVGSYYSRLAANMDDQGRDDLIHYVTRPEISTDPSRAQILLSQRFKALEFHDSRLTLTTNIENGLLILRAYDQQHGTSYASSAACAVIRSLTTVNSVSNPYSSIFSEAALAVVQSSRPDAISEFFAAMAVSPYRSTIVRAYSLNRLLNAVIFGDNVTRPNAEQVESLINDSIEYFEKDAEKIRFEDSKRHRLQEARGRAQLGANYFAVIGDTARVRHFKNEIRRLNGKMESSKSTDAVGQEAPRPSTLGQRVSGWLQSKLADLRRKPVTASSVINDRDRLLYEVHLLVDTSDRLKNNTFRGWTDLYLSRLSENDIRKLTNYLEGVADGTLTDLEPLYFVLGLVAELDARGRGSMVLTTVPSLLDRLLTILESSKGEPERTTVGVLSKVASLAMKAAAEHGRPELLEIFATRITKAFESNRNGNILRFSKERYSLDDKGEHCWAAFSRDIETLQSLNTEGRFDRFMEVLFQLFVATQMQAAKFYQGWYAGGGGFHNTERINSAARVSSQAVATFGFLAIEKAETANLDTDSLMRFFAALQYDSRGNRGLGRDFTAEEVFGWGDVPQSQPHNPYDLVTWGILNPQQTHELPAPPTELPPYNWN